MYRSKKRNKVRVKSSDVISLDVTDIDRFERGIGFGIDINCFISGISLSSSSSYSVNSGKYYDDVDDDYSFDDYVYDNVIHIYFYDDYEDDGHCIEYNNLKDFELFCVQNGYNVYGIDYSILMQSDVVHCCVNPLDDSSLLCDYSYSGLYWGIKGELSKYGNFIDNNAYRPEYERDIYDDLPY